MWQWHENALSGRRELVLKVNALKLQDTFLFPSDPAQVHLCIYWGIVTLPPATYWKKSIREVLLCLFPLAQWDSEVHTCSKGKMLNLVKLKSHQRFNSWSMTLPFEGHAICSNEKLLKIPANVIDFDRRPVEFLYVSNNRVDKWQQFLWWNREWHGIWVFQG